MNSARLSGTINNIVTFETNEVEICEAIVKQRETTYEHLLICYNIDDPKENPY